MDTWETRRPSSAVSASISADGVSSSEKQLCESLFFIFFINVSKDLRTLCFSCGALTVTVSVRVVESLDPARYKPKQHTHFSINILCLHIWDTTRRKKIKLQFGSIVSSDESGTGVQCAETQISLCNREHKHTHTHAQKSLCATFRNFLFLSGQTEKKERKLNSHSTDD